MVEFKKILEFIIYILKIVIYFDTKYVTFQKGGAAAASTPQGQEAIKKGGATAVLAVASTPQGQEAIKKAAPKAAAAAPKAAATKAAVPKSNSSNSSNSSNNSNNKNSDEKSKTDEAAENAGDAGFLWIFTYIKEIVMGVIKWFGGKIMKLISMILFASVAPIIPFFVSMAGMFGVIKFMMYKLRRL